jgi:hypothetical protein
MVRTPPRVVSANAYLSKEASAIEAIDAVRKSLRANGTAEMFGGASQASCGGSSSEYRNIKSGYGCH